MTTSLKEHASSAAAISLIAACACVACLMPPLNEKVLHNPALVTLTAIGIACGTLLHLYFVGLLARTYGRSPAKYIAIALFTLPIGSVVGLILLEWHERVNNAQRGAA